MPSLNDSESIWSFSHDILTHWGRVTHICIVNLTAIGSDNGLSPGRHQAIIWTVAGIFLIGPLGTNFNEILIEIWTFSFKKMHWKMSSGKWRPSCLCLNVLRVKDPGLRCNPHKPMPRPAIQWPNLHLTFWLEHWSLVQIACYFGEEPSFDRVLDLV